MVEAFHTILQPPYQAPANHSGPRPIILVPPVYRFFFTGSRPTQTFLGELVLRGMKDQVTGDSQRFRFCLFYIFMSRTTG